MSDTVELRVGATPLQSGDVALVNRGGAPAMVALGSAAAAAANEFATAAQGGLAGTALQPGAQIPWTDVTGKPSTFPPSAHTHPISAVTGLQSALDGKQATLVSGTNIKTINGVSVLGDGNIVVEGGEGGGATWGSVGGDLEDQTDLQAALDGKAAVSHSHAIADVTGLQGALDAKVAGVGIAAIELITTAEHAALDPPNPSTLYVKSDAPPSLAVMDAGGDANAARPEDAVSVLWINSPTEPTNAIAGVDLWIEAD